MTTTNIEPGTVVFAFPRDWNGLSCERVVVESIGDHYAMCALVSTDFDRATHLDVVLLKEETTLAYDVVVHSHALARIDVERLSGPLGRVERDVLDELQACRFGDPGTQFEHGAYLIPGLDPREPHLVETIRAFREQYGPAL